MKKKNSEKFKLGEKVFEDNDLYLRFQKSPAMQAMADHFKRIFEDCFMSNDQETLAKLKKLLDEEDEAQHFIQNLQAEVLEDCVEAAMATEKRKKKLAAINESEKVDQAKSLEQIKNLLN